MRLLKLGLCSTVAAFVISGQFSDISSHQALDAQEFFEKKVRPILVAKCQSCHNAKAKVAELDMTTAEGFAKGGESGPIVDLSNPQESRILKAIGYGEQLKMPPTGKLKNEDVATLTEWVQRGAIWPGAVATVTKEIEVEGGNPKSGRELTESEKNFWAFRPIADPSPPAVKGASWIRSPIDRFVLAKLEAQGLTPAPAASRLTLLRRATYDLTGLPPTEKEIQAFLLDRSPEAFPKVVERLLSSSRYGEQWGRHWLDVARYADSTGNDEDHRYPHAWRYRDWVIEAFNRDLRYNQFVRQQIAGDLLPADGDDGINGVNRAGIVATGFLALGAKALAQQDKKKMLYDVYDEQLDVTSKAFLGLTIACARCHDHKFDPILTKDYYSMVSIFASTRSFKDPMAFVSEPLNKPLVPKAVFDEYLAARRVHDDRGKRVHYEIDAILDSVKDPAVQKASSNLVEIMIAARRVYSENAAVSAEARHTGLDEAAFKRWVDYLKPGKPREHLLDWHNASPDDAKLVAQAYRDRFLKRLSEWDGKIVAWRKNYDEALAKGRSPLPDKPGFEAGHDRFFAEVYFNKEGPLSVTDADEAQLSVKDRESLKRLRLDRDQLKKQAPTEPAMACAVEDGEIVKQQIFVRGDYHSPAEDVSPAFPIVFADYAIPAKSSSGSGRMQLADWITRPENPLTPRVLVNRVWGWHFGEGLVRTPDNFGRMGEIPSHPQLLDFLARQFVDNGWSIKALHRMIMLSSAYQMSSRPPDAASSRDPDNRLLSRFNRRRLSVEEMRDGLLAVDGSLELQMGGTLQSGTGTDGENDNKRLSLNPEKLLRRTIYLPLRRANLPALLNLFDFGDATTVNGRRQLTNVPTQALFWLNSDFLAERSKNVAKLLFAQKGMTELQRIEHAYLRILNRRPTIQETTSARKYLAGYRARFTRGKTELDALGSLSRILMAANDFNYVD